MMLDFLIYAVLVVDLMGVVLIFIALLTHKMDAFDRKYRIAIAIVGLGFLGQITATFQVLTLDSSMLTKQLSFWIVKDMGLVLWFIYVFYDVQIKNLCFKIGHGHADGSTHS